MDFRNRAEFAGPDDPVFAARTGRPVDEHNIARRHLKPVGKRLAMPWLSWHCFRRTHTTLVNELGMAFTDRMAMMGHSELQADLSAIARLYTDWINCYVHSVNSGDQDETLVAS